MKRSLKATSIRSIAPVSAALLALASTHASAAGFALPTSVTASTISSGMTLNIPRLEKIHVSLAATFGGACGASNTGAGLGNYGFSYSSQFLHHDGEPLDLYSSDFHDDPSAGASVSVGITVDPNSSGSPAKRFRITSSANGSVASDYSCSNPYYCVGGLVFSTGVVPDTSKGLPPGNYTLIVTYWDGTYAAHTLVLGGLGSYAGSPADGNFGEVDSSVGGARSF